MESLTEKLPRIYPSQLGISMVQNRVDHVDVVCGFASTKTNIIESIGLVAMGLIRELKPLHSGDYYGLPDTWIFIDCRSMGTHKPLSTMCWEFSLSPIHIYSVGLGTFNILKEISKILPSSISTEILI